MKVKRKVESRFRLLSLFNMGKIKPVKDKNIAIDIKTLPLVEVIIIFLYKEKSLSNMILKPIMPNISQCHLSCVYPIAATNGKNSKLATLL